MEFLKDKKKDEEKKMAQLQQQTITNIDNNEKDEKARRIYGPIFISIGSVDQLNMFLDQNPNIPPDQILVDDYDHKSYKETMGFTRFDEITSINQLQGLKVSKLAIPLLKTLGIPKLMEYVKRIPSLAPLEGDLDWKDLPEGGLRNGGTLVLGGGIEQRILYRWNDKIPGDVPSPSDVYRKAEVQSFPIK